MSREIIYNLTLLAWDIRCRIRVDVHFRRSALLKNFGEKFCEKDIIPMLIVAICDAIPYLESDQNKRTLER
jgi:hypothetical protein